MRKVILILSLFPVLAFAQVEHQDLVKYKKLYPERTRISLNSITEVELSFNSKDSLDIITTIFEEDIYTDKRAATHNKKSVLDSYFYSVKDIEAKTLTPINETKYKTYKVKDFEEKAVLGKSIFFDDSKNISFEYPMMREGSITSLKYTTESHMPYLLRPCIFGDYTVAENQVYKVKHHKDIKLNFRKFNGIDTLAQYQKTVDGDFIIHSWVVKNQKPLEYESQSPSFISMIPHIYPVIEEYQRKGKTTTVLKTVDDLHNWYSKLLDMTPVKESDKIKKTVDSLIIDSKSELESVERIFDWVQKEVKYIAYEDGLGGFVPRPPDLVYDRRYGDCKDMALLQVEMLKVAGIKGHVAWVGTRDKPYKYQELPAPGCDNHMIAAYKGADGKWFFLDATGTYSPFGYPSEFIQGKEALIHLSSDKYEIVEIEKVAEHKNMSKDSLSLKIDGVKLIGSGKATYTGYLLSDVKYAIMDEDSLTRTESFKAMLEKGNNKFFFTPGTVDMSSNNIGSVSYAFEVRDYIKQSGNELYLNLNLDRVLTENKIDDNRKNPIELDFKKRFYSEFYLDLGNHKVKYLPENKADKTDERWDYAITYTHDKINNKITYVLEINLNALYMRVDEFKAWNDFVKIVSKAYKESIVLEKI